MTPFAGGKPWVFLKGCSAPSNFAKMQCLPVLRPWIRCFFGELSSVLERPETLWQPPAFPVVIFHIFPKERICCILSSIHLNTP